METARSPGVQSNAANGPGFAAALNSAMQGSAAGESGPQGTGQTGEVDVPETAPPETTGGKNAPEMPIDWASIAAQVLPMQAAPLSENGTAEAYQITSGTMVDDQTANAAIAGMSAIGS